MRILIVGNDPSEIGGVANYTRPLASKFTEMGHDVYYFYSGAYQKRYNWLFFPHLRVYKDKFPFECAEIVNSPNIAFNYESPDLDIHSPRIERIFLNYLDRVRPEVVHIHSRCGLPFSIARIASIRGIVVINTIHVYGLLCQKRVMIDNDGQPCKGPEVIEKCAVCTGKFDANRYKLAARLENTSQKISRLLINIKRKLKRSRSIKQSNDGVHSCLVPCKLTVGNLKERLHFNIESMNRFVDINLCVSSDVKTTLKKYGVLEDRLMVQHIGSVIAEKQKSYNGTLHNPVTIGNIGGVNYYKGTHVLINAISKVQHKDISVTIYGKYQQSFVDEIMSGKNSLPIKFFGKYLPTDLPKLMEGIDIMVLPSICNDTAPQTIFESYSAGIPIIASEIGGFTDFISDGINGRLFKPGDSDDLASRIDEILSNTDVIRRFARNIPKLKTIAENAKELVFIYNEYLKQKHY